LAISEIVYLSAEEAIALHILLMRSWDEVYFGVDRRDVLESALARAHQSATYENADVLRQAASLCFGLIRNHPWLGGNKRTATYLMEVFLELNGHELKARNREIVEAALKMESGEWTVDEIEAWLRLST
jgi:death-on-curing protein